jgi:hypothetical protein
LVRRRKWWRKDKKISIRFSRHLTLMLKRREKIKKLLSGRCFNYLGHNHLVARCKGPTKCWFCCKPWHVVAACKLRCSIPHVVPEPSLAKPAFSHAASPSTERVQRRPTMDCHLSFRGASGDHDQLKRPESPLLERVSCDRAKDINFPSNPRFRPQCTFKALKTSTEMEQRHHHLSSHAILISDVGPRRVQSREEVKEVIQLHLGIRKHDFVVFRSNPKPFIAIFNDPNARDFVFAATHVADGPIEINFHG